MTTHSNKKRGIRLMDVPHMPAEQAIILLMHIPTHGDRSITFMPITQ
mgnify:CR=1 FL=1